MPRKPREPLILYEASFVRSEVDRLLEAAKRAHLDILHDAMRRLDVFLEALAAEVETYAQQQHACITELKARIRELEQQLAEVQK
jgi:hypothetical protein